MTDQRLTPQDEQLVRRCLREGAQAFDHTFMEKLLAEIDRLRGERQWLPMETAPKDQDILAWLETERCAMVFWRPQSGRWWEHGMGGVTPLAWMHLPVAPDATVPSRPQEATTSESVKER